MNYCTIENTDILVSRIGFGTASLHHSISQNNRIKLISYAASLGITHFDTSPYYGYGLAELDLGKFLSGHRNSFTVTTKVGLYPSRFYARDSFSVRIIKSVGKFFPYVSIPKINWQVDYARASLVSSLKRLKTDYVDFLFLHEPDPLLMQSDELLRWVESEKNAGNIRAWGIAGVENCVAPFTLSDHPLSAIVQTKDTIDHKQADFILQHGRKLQFTYGYLSDIKQSKSMPDIDLVIKQVLNRNKTGSILFTSSRTEHLYSLSEMVNQVNHE
jgi:aryl-alcohol dehydrogenase-like predicted oxidoreductase